ncbi:tumor necrosis factor receptor superfamily member 10a-like [Limosa lapponica baueri]|uniref:Tumor necrosis factor receptor superfamily member 10a-like n=1 Tax=Limosa lapponica baueri TaxID=1758121 RepID=A0A2I0TE81_LIMLA|nr:tumor necrosis factor receptor superfamily member 10a-like [Limosa lapponica baueri]
MRWAPRRRCLLLLLVVAGAVLEASAVALGRRDKLDPLDPGRGGEEYYYVQESNLYCKKCPPGKYVASHCKEPNGSSLCLPCKDDESIGYPNEYTEYPNDFLKCLPCRTCREDEVETSPCRPTSNTQCACKSGTFCSPDHPCEMCQKCRPRCSQDEVELAPCTPHSDRQCGPPTGTMSSSSYNWIVIVSVVVPAMFLLAVAIALRKYGCCCCPRDGRDLSRKSCSVVDYLMRRVTRYQRGRPETQDNNRNERRNLVPVPGQDPVTLLRRSFEFFAQDVPYKDWKRYGRALDLLENDIVLAELNDKYSLEPFFQMLNTWLNRQGMNASVNTLLETLRRINLGGVAEDISSKLVQQGFFQYEAS